MIIKYKEVITRGLKIMKKTIFTLIMVLIFLMGCSVTNVDKTEKYQGERLRIGVIGDVPEIRESQVKFEKIDFDLLKEDDFNSRYDAIFITQNNLPDASKDEYAVIYKNSNIPFYFIETEKSYVPFAYEGLSYENALDFAKDMYITGLLYNKNNSKYRTWGYGLYNDTKNEPNIKGVYSRVFADISEIQNNRLP